MLRSKDFGVYLGEEDTEESVLLPRKQVPADLKTGDSIAVFIYRDSQDRKIATVNRPKLTAGEIGKLKVVSVGGIGAFMDCGLERDVLLPFKEQTTKVATGKEYLVYMYVDKSERLCVTMRLYSHLNHQPPYEKNDYFKGTVYEWKDHMGAFVAVDNKYSGLIPKSEIYQKIHVGDEVEGRVLNVREDGKMDLTLQKDGMAKVDDFSAVLLDHIKQQGGHTPFNDKSAAEDIYEAFGVSKKTFKKAVGDLYKRRLVLLAEDGIHLV